MKSKRSAIIAGIFAEAKKRGIESDKLRNEIAPFLINKRLSEAEFSDLGVVIDWLKGRGNDDASFDEERSDGEALRFRPSTKQYRYVMYLQGRYQWDLEDGFERWIKKRFGVDDIKAAPRWELSKIIEALKEMTARGVNKLTKAKN